MSNPEASGPQEDRLFYEQGASWRWLLGGPLAAIALIAVQRSAGLGFQPLVPLFFLVLLTGVFTVQVKAARVHTSVELTREALREGTETILISEILRVYPEPEGRQRRSSALDAIRKSTAAVEPWQSARTLGELNGIPKGRVPIGLKLTKDRTAQAWARDHETLRAALTGLVEARQR
jgi:hypothetical protein